MTILYVLLPLALLCGAGAVFAFVWAVESGQLDDLETPPLRILGEDESTTIRHTSDTKSESR
jgi:cbb3-type cytochrome oxidase maturation protein